MVYKPQGPKIVSISFSAWLYMGLVYPDKGSVRSGTAYGKKGKLNYRIFC